LPGRKRAAKSNFTRNLKTFKFRNDKIYKSCSRPRSVKKSELAPKTIIRE